MEMEIQKADKIEGKNIYPIIEKMVDAYYTQTSKMLDMTIEAESDKSIFMMYIILYFGIHTKLYNTDANSKKVIKEALNDMIRDPEKRKVCINVIEKKFRNLLESNVEAGLSKHSFVLLD